MFQRFFVYVPEVVNRMIHMCLINIQINHYICAEYIILYIVVVYTFNNVYF